jgi:cellulose synthase operon protein C
MLGEVGGAAAARAELDRLVAAAEDPHPYRRALAGLDLAEGAVDRAIEGLRAIVAETEPSDRQARQPGGARRPPRGDRRRGRERGHRRRVLGEDPSHVAALKRRAEAEIAADRPDDAIASLRTALDQAPRDPEILTLMAAAHERAGAHDLAGERLALAVEVSGSAAAESIRYARFLMENGRQGPAETVLNNALRRAPEDVDLLAALGELHLRRSDWRAAGAVA